MNLFKIFIVALSAMMANQAFGDAPCSLVSKTGPTSYVFRAPGIETIRINENSIFSSFGTKDRYLTILEASSRLQKPVCLQFDYAGGEVILNAIDNLDGTRIYP